MPNTPHAPPPGSEPAPGSRSPRSVEEYRRLYEMTLKEWLIYHQKHIVFGRSKWMGVTALKNPLDSWIYQELIHEVQPDVIIEIGSAHGGSTLFLAHMLDLIGKGIVISIDINRDTFHVRHERIVLLTGDSSSPEILDRVAGLCAGKTAMVLHDGDHRKETVLRELHAYSRFVPVGSYFLVEDGIVDLWDREEAFDAFQEDGPMKAVEQFLRETSDFEVDDRCERYLLTYSPMGFLRRVRWTEPTP